MLDLPVLFPRISNYHNACIAPNELVLTLQSSRRGAAHHVIFGPAPRPSPQLTLFHAIVRHRRSRLAMSAYNDAPDIGGARWWTPKAVWIDLYPGLGFIAKSPLASDVSLRIVGWLSAKEPLPLVAWSPRENTSTCEWISETYTHPRPARFRNAHKGVLGEGAVTSGHATISSTGLSSGRGRRRAESARPCRIRPALAILSGTQLKSGRGLPPLNFYRVEAKWTFPRPGGNDIRESTRGSTFSEDGHLVSGSSPNVAFPLAPDPAL
ncbi:hypothetical protein B0H16DRAFT_1462918 [Mycena metata]|uniref:Uncharacterized protein n=1 Tax=Mycena metata TaxID=1033252 RepID=A0AAD7IK82_9AGAR|nr:hypothetical protein B0H16DRAFT_1462918 [Mycena metata]